MFIYFSSLTGILYLEGSLSSSTITNSTFREIIALYSGSDTVYYPNGDSRTTYYGTYGGVLYLSTPNYSTFTIHRCVFTQCNALYGGALYLSSSTPFITITQTRFQSNSATSNGEDIYVGTSPCFNSHSSGSGSLASSTCSTTTAYGDSRRVYCNGSGIGGQTTQLQNNCAEDIV
jgi:hypothetical protein